MRASFALITLALLGGCRGYVVDRLKPRSELVAPQLARYGVSGEQGQCVEQRLTKGLSIWQLRQFHDLASRLTAGGSNPAALSPSDLVYVAGLVRDPKVAAQVQGALQECQVSSAPAAPVQTAVNPPAPAAEASTAPVPQMPSSSPAPVASSADTPLWVNLGAAASGQGIAVDARSVVREGSARQAWFRLLRINGDSIVGETGYLLRVNCDARTVTAHAGRTYGAGGALVQQKDYATPEGPLKIEGGTVIEVAFHALCDEAK